jgi:hypothetical protein
VSHEHALAIGVLFKDLWAYNAITVDWEQILLVASGKQERQSAAFV